MLKKIKSADKRLSFYLLLVFGIGCFYCGFVFAEETYVGNIFALPPSLVALMSATPYVLILAILGVMKYFVHRYIVTAEKVEDSSNEKVRYY